VAASAGHEKTLVIDEGVCLSVRAKRTPGEILRRFGIEY